VKRTWCRENVSAIEKTLLITCFFWPLVSGNCPQIVKSFVSGKRNRWAKNFIRLGKRHYITDVAKMTLENLKRYLCRESVIVVLKTSLVSGNRHQMIGVGKIPLESGQRPWCP
jgi:hypothetical protein